MVIAYDRRILRIDSDLKQIYKKYVCGGEPDDNIRIKGTKLFFDLSKCMPSAFIR